MLRGKRSEEGVGKFVVAGGNAAEDFDPSEEVFDLMAASVVTAMKAGRLPSAPLGRDAAAALAAEAGAENIGIEALSATIRRPRAPTTADNLVFIYLWCDPSLGPPAHRAD